MFSVPNLSETIALTMYWYCHVDYFLCGEAIGRNLVIHAVFSCFLLPSVFAVNAQVKFREFVPSILNVSRQCLASGEEDVAVIAFEIFDELIESPAPLLGESVKAIVHFALEVCSSQNLETSTRHQVGIIS